MGPRPLLTVADVTAELTIPGVPVQEDFRVGPSVRLQRGRRVRFDEWCQQEAHLLQRLRDQEPPERALAPGHAFARLKGRGWGDVGRLLQQVRDPSGFGEAARWFGDALLRLSEDQPEAPRPRPWARFFVAAEARTPTPQDGDEMVRDWLADEVWSLQWTQFGSFARARHDLLLRLAVLRQLARRLEAGGTRADRAVAEALMIVDVITHAQHWYDVMRDYEEA